ncbi:MAG: hypothetical protein ABIF77_03035, partial [bacterium]
MSRCLDRRRTVRMCFLLCCCLALALANGCGDEGAITEPPMTPTLPEGYPETPDQLMDNFRAAYSGLDSLAYAALLHPDYRFLFSGPDLNLMELLTGYLTATEELTIAWNMFSGQATPKQSVGADLSAAAGAGAGIGSITFVRFDPMDSEWYESPREFAVPGFTAPPVQSRDPRGTT